MELNELRPGLDPSVYSRLGSLTLHESGLPLDSYGLGTKRLIGLALQLSMAGGGSLLLVDEVEAGLDPHRLRRFIGELQGIADQGDQVILVTHSPLVVEQLGATSLSVVRSSDGTTIVEQVPDQLNEERSSYDGVVRSAPSALLARRVIVGEGSTEVGFVEGLLSILEKKLDRSASAHGVAVANGSDGRQAALRGRLLRRLGYEVAMVVDHDDPGIDEEVALARDAGVTLVQWDRGHCLEDQIFEEVPAQTLDDLFELAVDIREDELGEDGDHRAALRASVESRLPNGTRLSGASPSVWIASGVDAGAVRSALGMTANKGKWFKRQTHGQRLGLVVCAADLEPGALSSALVSLEAFAFPPLVDAV